MNTSSIKSSLEERLEKLEFRLEKVKLDATKPHSTDSIEQAQERENDEVLDQIGNETQLSIEHIKAALISIKNGTYGTCENCHNNIDEGRLVIIPESTLCVNCAD